MSFRLLFRSLHFLALVFATISLVCFGAQEKKIAVSVFPCSAVPLFRGLVMPVIGRQTKVSNQNNELNSVDIRQ